MRSSFHADRPAARRVLACFKILVCLALPLFGDSALAMATAGLYRADLPVQNKDEPTRADAFRRGLNQVLKRVVRPEDLASGTVKSLLAKPESVVLQFEYPGETREGRPILRVDFDAARLAQLLGKRGIGVWGAERPDILAWIAIEDSQPPRIFSQEQSPELDRLLSERAAEYGLSVTVPLGDLTDEQALNTGDIATGNAERIRMASVRYEAPVILAGRLVSKPGGGVEADWRLYQGSKEDRWQGKSKDTGEAIGAGVTELYTRLASRSIPRTLAVSTQALRVVGIASLDDANRVTAYLNKLSPVTKVEWQAAGADDASFRVSVRGGREMLEQTLALGTLLRPDTGDSHGFSGLTYRMVK
ncbi:DUF2066 domain-containing protein [Methylomagnum sp.]